MKRKVMGWLFGLLFLVGLGILLYPTVSDWWNAYRQSKLISNYEDAVAELDIEGYEELWAEARIYNGALWAKGNRYVFSEEDRKEYDALLDVSGNGIMGYIEIPAIDCSLPIYHGTDEEVLQIAIGHLEGTSLPVGGEDTHCVLSGHRGLPSAKLFSNLDQLSKGDLFLLQILGETLTYEIDQVLTVLPEEMEALELARGKDYCTLVTCTPYGVNTHRLLVRGTRIETAQEEPQGTYESLNGQAESRDGLPVWMRVGVAAVVLISVSTIWLLFRKRNR